MVLLMTHLINHWLMVTEIRCVPDVAMVGILFFGV